MNDSLELIEKISKDRLLEAWEKEDKASGHTDMFMDQRREEHRAHEGLNYYLAALTERGLEQVVLGWHQHPDRERVKPGGELFWDVVARYWQEMERNQTDDCLGRLHTIKGELDGVFRDFESFVMADYSLGRLFNCRDLAVDSDQYFRDHGDGKLYAGNFHRFPGYGLWIKKHGFRPIKVYYCERPA
ncbi:MAG: hypothetical protein K8L99_00995 [Anaerolineae bacterium]|nr:hypothetical protein [Anaerolineae bacterium]